MMMMNIGLGYRFHPTDIEMLFLLRAKAEGKQTPPIIIERDIYGENATPWMLFKEDDPWQIEVENSGRSKKDTKLLYVITKLVKLSKLKTVRIAGCGTWDGQTGKSDIKMNGKKIGYKKMLNFRANATSNAFGNWIMHEYHLDGDFLKGLSSDYVICRIKWVNSTTSGKSCTSYSKTETEASEVQEYSNSTDCTSMVQEKAKRKNPVACQENSCSGNKLFKRRRVEDDLEESSNTTVHAAGETSSCDLAAQPVPVVEELPELVHVNGEESMTNNGDVFSGLQMDGRSDGLPDTIDFDNWEVKDLDQYFDKEQQSDDCQGVQIHSDPIVPAISNLNSTYTASALSQQEHSVDGQGDVESIGSDIMGVSNPNPMHASSAVAEQEHLELRDSADGQRDVQLIGSDIVGVEELPELFHVNGEESMTNNGEVFNGVQNDDLRETVDFKEQLSDDCQGVQIQGDSIVPAINNLNSTYTASVMSQQQHSVDGQGDELITSDIMGLSNPNPTYESSAVAEQEHLELQNSVEYQGIGIASDIVENEFGRNLNPTSWLDDIMSLPSPPPSYESFFEDLWH